MLFKHWLLEIWAEHVDEKLTWEHESPEYSPGEYFARYKWWLRREYRYRQGKLL